MCCDHLPLYLSCATPTDWKKASRNGEYWLRHHCATCHNWVVGRKTTWKSMFQVWLITITRLWSLSKTRLHISVTQEQPPWCGTASSSFYQQECKQKVPKEQENAHAVAFIMPWYCLANHSMNPWLPSYKKRLLAMNPLWALQQLLEPDSQLIVIRGMMCRWSWKGSPTNVDDELICVGPRPSQRPCRHTTGHLGYCQDNDTTQCFPCLPILE